MAGVDFLPGITKEEVTKLKALKYNSSDDVWNKLSEDKAGTLNGLAGSVGIDAPRLVFLLAADIETNTAAIQGGFTRRHWIDLSVVLVVVILLFALWRSPISPTQSPTLSLLRLPLTELPSDPTRKTPYRAILIASPRSTAEPFLEEVTVIELQKEKAPVVSVELRQEQIRRIAQVLGTADFYLLQSK